MIKRQIELDKSPFEKQKNMTAPRGSEHLQAQISQDMFDDFIKYAERYNKAHDIPPTKKGEVNKSAPLKHIINEFLNTHAIERRCIQHLHVIMLFNKIEFATPFNTDVDCAVIGFVEHPDKFTMFHPFRAVPDKFNTSGCIYAVENFNKETFDLLNLKQFDSEVLFNIPPSIHADFNKVRELLQEQHKHIDVDNAQICVFNLNNYLDVLQDGVYTSRRSTYTHEGLITLRDPDDVFKLNRIVARITWSYIAGVFTFEFNVEREDYFNDTVILDLPEIVQNETGLIFSGFLSQPAKHMLNIQRAEKDIERLENEIKQNKEDIEERKKLIAESEKAIDEFKKQL